MWAVMHRDGLSMADIRDRIMCSSGVVTRWAAGKRRPSMAMALALEREFGIPHLSWWEEA